MKNVIILGANGNIAKHVIDILIDMKDINLTLFVRDKSRLRNTEAQLALPAGSRRIIEGDVLNFDQLKEAIKDQDIVYVNLAGDMEAMVKNIVKAMEETGVKRVIFINSIGIYDDPIKPALNPYRKAADIIEASSLDYTILRPAWFTDIDEMDYEITRKGEPEKGTVISQKSLATFIATVIESPEKYVRENLGINKPTTS